MVAIINKEWVKTVFSKCEKANLHREIRRIWDGNCPKPLKSKIEARCAVQIKQLKNAKLFEDKLDYLIEDMKPDSHKNAVSDRFPITGVCS